MLYNPPTGGAANDPYVGANIAAGIQGSKVPPGAVEFPQRELVSLITAAGLAPTNTDLQQALRAVRSGILEYSVDAGAVNAPAIAPSPAHTQLVDGLHVRVRMKAAPTGPSTLSVSSLVAPIQYLGGGALTGGDWAANDVVDLVYSAPRNAFQFLGLTISQVNSQIQAALPPPTPRLLSFVVDKSTAANVYRGTGYPVTLTQYVNGLQLEIVPQFANTGAATINVDQLGAVPILRNDSSALLPNDIAAGTLLTLVFNAASGVFLIDGFANSQVVRQLPPGASTTLWVRTDGSDSNNGSANNPGAAFKTILAAITYGLSQFSLTGGALTIEMGIAGTYAAPGFLPPVLGTLNIVGGAGNNQANFIVSGAGPTGAAGLGALIFSQGGTINLTGFTIQNTGSRNYSIVAGSGSVNIQNLTFTSTQSNPYAFLAPGSGGALNDDGGCIYAGSMGNLASVTNGYLTFAANPSIASNPAFNTTISCGPGGFVYLNPGVTFQGTNAQGTRYSVSPLGFIQTFGAGAQAFPGNAAGVTNPGGYYQ